VHQLFAWRRIEVELAILTDPAQDVTGQSGASEHQGFGGAPLVGLLINVRLGRIQSLSSPAEESS
jgi:hypothetical protein